MTRRVVFVLMLALGFSGAARAQTSGGRVGGRSDRAPTSVDANAPNKIELIGVIRAIDLVGERITIAYEPVDALSWPAGTMPFAVSRPQLLKGALVGEKVRFKLDSQQISALEPFVSAPNPQ